jgi:2C-methyl-D-erythritol 2,4-cyclodiphosphate synthase
MDALTRLAVAVGTVRESRLNVKASTPEGLGTLGRGEGMAAAAFLMLECDERE